MSQQHSFSNDEIVEFKNHFELMDKDNSGKLDANEVMEVFNELKMETNIDEVQKYIDQVDINKDGTVDFDEFLLVCENMKNGQSSAFGSAVKEHKKIVQVAGFAGTHTYAEEEMAAFASHINQCLKGDPDLDYLLPINPNGMDLCNKVGDGVLLAKFINVVIPDTIDERALNKKKDKMSLFQVNENLNLVVASATGIGISTVNVGAGELREGAKFPHLVLGIIWQLVKLQLLGSIDLKNHPELMRLLEDGEELADLLKLPPDQLLLRWFNYHLKNAGWPRRVTNFTTDIKDSENYTVLLNQISPQQCGREALDANDLHQRAGMVLGNAEKLGVATFIQPNDIVRGNHRLNLAFTAAIFNQCPGLDPLEQEQLEELEKAGLMDDDFGDSREERAFRMWINSLGIDGLYINSLYEDCKDGLALLRIMDRIEPGVVNWKQVEMKPNNKFKKVHNCNYVVDLGKNAFKFSLVGIGGTDIVDGNKKLLLALTWQLMRYHVLKFLNKVKDEKFGGKEVTEAMIIEWANARVATTGCNERMKNFKDKNLSTGVFFLNLLRAVEPRIINDEFVTDGNTPEDALLNARYAVSLARKLGAIVFVLPEDLVDVRPKLCLTFVASCMAISP